VSKSEQDTVITATLAENKFTEATTSRLYYEPLSTTHNFAKR